MASSDVDQKFLGRLATSIGSSNVLLSSALYQILGLSVLLSRKLYRARKLRKLDTSRDTKSLALYQHIIWLSREGLNSSKPMSSVPPKMASMDPSVASWSPNYAPPSSTSFVYSTTNPPCHNPASLFFRPRFLWHRTRPTTEEEPTARQMETRHQAARQSNPNSGIRFHQ